MSRAASIAKPSLALLLKPLRAFSARSAAAVGDVYARAAQALLEQSERLEDAAAERRYSSQARHGAEQPAAQSGTAVAKSTLS